MQCISESKKPIVLSLLSLKISPVNVDELVWLNKGQLHNLYVVFIEFYASPFSDLLLVK